jgi:light-regulated signal transduction histidine kinase (bacteriophytochrome)
MKNDKELFSYESLAFFGRVNASISHELKNIMAIISETAGLLNDITEMATEGHAINSDLLQTSARSIMEEIQRGFKTIRQMNRFAHCVDTPVESVRLEEILDLVINIAGYLAYSGTTRMRSLKNEKGMVVTSPLLLAAVVYHALIFSYKNSGPDAEIEIDLSQWNDKMWRIAIHGFNIKPFQTFPDEHLEKIAGSIGVGIQCDRFNNRLDLDVPTNLDDYSIQSDGMTSAN